MTTKQTVINSIAELPDDATYEQIMEKLYFSRKLELSLRDLDEGRGISHEDARQKLSQWLNP